MFRSGCPITVVYIYPLLKLDDGRRLFNAAYILQQGQLKTLCLQIFIVMSLSASGKLFCGGAALSVCHGGVLPIAFYTGYHIPPHFSRANVKLSGAFYATVLPGSVTL